MITNVNVVDVVGGRVRPDMTIVIRGGRILTIARRPSRNQASTRLIDGHGLYAVPGLWDSHVHLSDATEPEIASTLFPRFLQAGVTSVRDMGGSLAVVDAAVAASNGNAPHVLRPGPFVDGPKEGAPDREVVHAPAEAEPAVARIAAQGADFIKVHNGLSRESFLAVAAAARRRRLPLAVHLPRSITAVDAAQAGAQTFEHTETLLESGLRRLSLPGADVAQARAALEEEVRTVPRVFVETHTCYTPTLAEYRSFAGLPARSYAVAAEPEAPPSLRAFWARYSSPPPSPAQAAARQSVFAIFRTVVKRFSDAGVTILAGTDLGVEGLYPGLSLHEELSLLSDSGLSNLQVLQAATINPARCLGRARDYGTLEPGKIADILLIEGDPIRELGNLGRIRAVFLAGREVR